jgi:hypothetical protein
MVEVIVADRVVEEKPDQKISFGSPVIVGRKILRWIFRKRKGCMDGIVWLRVGRYCGIL